MFGDFPAGTTVAADGQIAGSGCVFPTSVPTVADQLDAAHLTWKAYMEDMGNVPTRESAVCGHPAVGSVDQTQRAVPGDGYATRHDPFVYFHSIIDNTALCDARVVPLGSTRPAPCRPRAPAGTTGLATDLEKVSTTPNLSFITPNLCTDGHDAPCINQSGAPTAGANIDAFLSTWVPTDHRARRPSEGRPPDRHLRRGRRRRARTRRHGLLQRAARTGGGLAGRYRAGRRVARARWWSRRSSGPAPVSNVPYNHYSTLGTIEALFGLSRLGQAATVSATFGPTCSPPTSAPGAGT